MSSVAGDWACAPHGTTGGRACERCGTFFCATCTGGVLCGACHASALQRAAFERRQRGVRWTIAALLLTGAFFLAAPSLLAGALELKRGREIEASAVLLTFLLCGPPLVSAVLILVSRRYWVAWLALPTTLMAAALVLSGLGKNGLGGSYGLGVLGVLTALLRSIQGWRSRAAFSSGLSPRVESE